jgi:hypothetical protein
VLKDHFWIKNLSASKSLSFRLSFIVTQLSTSATASHSNTPTTSAPTSPVAVRVADPYFENVLTTRGADDTESVPGVTVFPEGGLIEPGKSGKIEVWLSRTVQSLRNVELITVCVHEERRDLNGKEGTGGLKEAAECQKVEISFSPDVILRPVLNLERERLSGDRVALFVLSFLFSVLLCLL